jgi:hypothetical protein
MGLEKLDICIIYDSTDLKKQRTSFWGQALQQWCRPPPQGRYLSLSHKCLHEEAARARYMGFDSPVSYDVVIFNWDVLNGDPTFASDRSQQIARYYAPALRRFVELGGLVVLECQAVRWSPCQNAYDAILVEAGLPRLRVANSKRISFGFSVKPAKRLVGQHPFLPTGLPHQIEAGECDWNRARAWFPRYSVSLKVVRALQGTWHRVYSGAFVRVKKRHWQPILYTEDGRYPVACVYHNRGEGAYLVTTMYLASTNITELLRPITIEWPESRRRLDDIASRRYLPNVHRRTRTVADLFY